MLMYVANTYTPGHRSTGDGLSSIVAIVIGATAGTILLSICAICLLFVPVIPYP